MLEDECGVADGERIPFIRVQESYGKGNGNLLYGSGMRSA